MALNQFPPRAPIGRATINGQTFDVLMTAEFSRAISEKQTVSGSLSDGSALASLIQALAKLGLISDTTTP